MASRVNRSQVSSVNVLRAAVMRAAPTPSEERLWQALRGGQLGVRFLRQVPVGSFIVDFLAPSARLIVEVDGAAYHAGRASADARRTRNLERAGYRVLRVTADDVHRELDAVLKKIRQALG